MREPEVSKVDLPLVGRASSPSGAFVMLAVSVVASFTSGLAGLATTDTRNPVSSCAPAILAPAPGPARGATRMDESDGQAARRYVKSAEAEELSRSHSAYLYLSLRIGD